MAGGTAEANRILLGMRDSAERRELATWLAAEGYHVSHCSDQPSLAQRIDATVAAVILADEPATAPLDEVSAALERLPAGSAIPFILLSRDAEPYAALRARLPAAINDFVVLEEPVWPTTLLSCLATCLRVHQQQRAHHAEVIERADQQARFERLIVNLPIGVSFIDPHGNTLLSNPKYDEYVPNRKIPSAAPERARRWVGLDSQGQVIPPSHYVGARALRGEQVNGQDYRYYPEEGGERWLRLSGVPLYDHAEQLMGAAVVIIDVDAERRNEVMLRQFNHALEHEVDLRTQALQEALDRLTVEIQERNHAEELLRHSQKMEAVGQLTGGIAHDFNNMLTGIIGGLDLIQRYIQSGRHGETQRFIDAAVTSANRAAALTHRLLAFARRQPLNLKRVELNQLIESMHDLLSRTLGSHIHIRNQLQQGLWPVSSDENQLESALLNLVINARDAMADGGTLLLETRNVELYRQGDVGDLAAGRYVILCLTDTGCGMSPKVLASVFEPFFTTKPIGQGTGLGLSMVYGFTRQAGGHIQIASEPGEGTQVSLYLPVFEDQGVSVAPAGEDDGPLQAQQGETVLVVEDDPAVRLLVIDVLQMLGYQTLEAADGNAAIRLLESTPTIDMLVTDVGLPGMNGRQLADVARQHRPDLPVLFMTGYAKQAASADFLEPGMDMISKPFNLDALAKRVRDMLADSDQR